MPMDSLQDLYLHKLQDLYSAEQQIAEALPQMAALADAPELQRGFEMHLGQTEQQIQRLEQLFQSLGEQPGGEECKGMKGIIEEGQKAMQEVKDPDALDAALIAAAQAVEHYEMAGYGTARTWARQLGRDQDARVLQQTLDEEGETDKLLTRIAESMVNQQAMQGEREVSRGVSHEGAMGQGAARRQRPESGRPSAER